MVGVLARGDKVLDDLARAWVGPTSAEIAQQQAQAGAQAGSQLAQASARAYVMVPLRWVW
jgi:hypothetical protein